MSTICGVNPNTIPPSEICISGASTVVSETSFSQSPSVGTSDNYSREDHTHGTPPTPTLAPNSVPIGTLTPNIPRYGIPGWSFTQSSSLQFTAGDIYYVPIYVSKTSTFIKAAIHVQTPSASTVADIRIFNWNDGIPSSFVTSLGLFDCTTTGIKENDINITLNKGFYFLAMRCDNGSPSLFYIGTSISSPSVVPVSGINNSNNPSTSDFTRVTMTVTSTYTDPAPAPTGLYQNAPMILLRDN